jgi:Tfp pilus assembly protein PilN
MIKINLLGDTLAQVGAGKKSDKAEAIQVYAEAEAASRSSLPIAGVLFGLVLASAGGIYYVYLNRQVEVAKRTQAELQAKKKDLEKYMTLEKTFRSQKDSLAKKKEVMMGLKSFQHLPVHLIEELANALPDDVWFKEVSQKGMAISLKGESNSFEAVNAFRNRLIEQKKWFQNVNYPAATKNGRTVEFTISCDLKNSA